MSGVKVALTIMWFRDDLRIADNPALKWAQERGEVVAVFIEEQHQTLRPLGVAARWWQENSLHHLEHQLSAIDLKFCRLAGDPQQLIVELVHQTGADAVTWNRRYHQPLCALDAALKASLIQQGLEVHSHAGYLLNEPWDIKTGQGTAYKVFSPFAKKSFALAENAAQTMVRDREMPDLEPGFVLGDAAIGVVPDWQQRLAQHCAPGEISARQKLDKFLDFLSSGGDYSTDRDDMAHDGTSGLSPHLRFGELSIHRLWFEVSSRAERGEIAPESAQAFLNELLWRDFSWHRLYAHPMMHWNNIRSSFDRFPWEWDQAESLRLAKSQRDPRRAYSDSAFQETFAAWRAGQTGIPLVDAGMRELWESGTMHNRARMVVASFLTKNLLIHWRHGEQWFWDTLVDADLAANAFNWQWAAGCGDDASPYFRIFNPETQAKKFDPQRRYIRRWIKDFDTPSYPPAIVDLATSRQEALEAYQSIK